jgi:hypothetical protein
MFGSRSPTRVPSTGKARHWEPGPPASGLRYFCEIDDLRGDGLFEAIIAVSNPQGDADHVEGNANDARSMTKSDRFREYAEEALRWSSQSSTKEEKKALIELASLGRKLPR